MRYCDTMFEQRVFLNMCYVSMTSRRGRQAVDVKRGRGYVPTSRQREAKVRCSVYQLQSRGKVVYPVEI